MPSPYNDGHATDISRVIERFRSDILANRVLPGDKLPSTREAAKMLDVHHLTVTEAYRRLAADGLVLLRNRVGAFVAEAPMGGEVLVCMGQWESSDSHPAAISGAIGQHGAIRGAVITFMVVQNAEELLLPAFKARLSRGLLRGVWMGSIPPHLARGAVELLSRYSVPVVHLSQHRVSPFTVSHDAPKAIRMGTRHLIEQGCTRIALLGFGMDRFPEREEAFFATCEALDASGEVLAMPYKDLAGLAAFERHGSQAAEALFARSDPPDGLMLADDGIGRGALTALLRLQIRVPEDVRICTHARVGSSYPGIFGMPVARLLQDEEEQADAACRMMESLMAGEEIPEPHLRLPPRLVAAQEAAAVSNVSGGGNW